MLRSRLSAVVEDIAHPRESFAVFEVMRVNVVVVCFALEWIAAVAAFSVAVSNGEDKPEAEIEQPLKDEAEFSLLQVMNALVVPYPRVCRSTAPDPPPEAYGVDIDRCELRQKLWHLAVFVEYWILHTCPHVWRHCARV